ncbi:hypothetical protein X777_08159 [Ooceraea biroi]|uniref:DDE Tnp4 domain-containing protein n=1 Tax=Ooceraea biroi TaxID=2015173 RepID=A0A026WY29_OOCBI|nr:hypothetical protein X777_08159 [Ooceraea biroi]
MIASLLGLEREQQVSEYSQSVLHSFEKDILPRHFGINAVSRKELIKNHTSEIAQKLYNVENKLMIISDGTYCRHEKSTNNEYQRKSFSGQKKVPLCKPFTLCTTDGYIIGFEVLMPALKGKRSQLPTDESNESRFVTKLRWVVEAVHENAKLYFRIASFLHNKFGKRLNSDHDLTDEIVDMMKLRRCEKNTLFAEVEAKKWIRRKLPFRSLTSKDLLDFPEMTERDLKILFTGSYQLSQAVSYLA